MGYWEKKLIREQLDKQLSATTNLWSFPSHKSWIKVLREALGMTTNQLAQRMGISQPRVIQLEKAEPAGNLKLSTMENVAEGLGMKFIYGFVSKEGLESMVREQARRIAIQRLGRLDRTMRLEQQGLSEEDKKAALEDMVDRILLEEEKELWTIN